MMAATNIHYERADRVRALSAGGIGALLLMTQKIADSTVFCVQALHPPSEAEM